MANTALIPVFTGTIAGTAVQLCDARTLHAFMQVLRDFSTWIKGRIRKYGFVEGVDFILAPGEVFTKSGENLGGRPVVGYHLTLDMAKELSMVENNDMGRQARRYFIECEKILTHPQAHPATITPTPNADMLQAASEAGLQVQRAVLGALVQHQGSGSLRFAVRVGHGTAAVVPVPDDAVVATIAQITRMVAQGEVQGQELLDLAIASTQSLFRNACNQPSGWGNEVARKIDRHLPMADLHAIAVRATMEMDLRVFSAQMEREKQQQAA